MPATVTNHISLDDHGTAWVRGTNIKVIEIALDHVAHGWSPAEIAYQHYHTLSQGQIHAALAHYYDNQPEYDAEMERQVRVTDEARAKTLASPGRQKLKALGLLP